MSSAPAEAGRPALSPRWRLLPDRLEADIALAGFAQVRAFVTGLMGLADALDHHPEVRFGYRQVSVTWTTHDSGGVTASDWQAAAATDRLLESVSLS